MRTVSQTRHVAQGLRDAINFLFKGSLFDAALQYSVGLQKNECPVSDFRPTKRSLDDLGPSVEGKYCVYRRRCSVDKIPL